MGRDTVEARNGLPVAILSADTRQCVTGINGKCRLAHPAIVFSAHLFAIAQINANEERI